MAKILEGKTARIFYADKLKERIAALRVPPRLAIIQVGNRPESLAYIKAKIKFGAAIGAAVVHFQFDELVSEETVLEKILELNNSPEISGIIVQLPLPANFSGQRIIDAILPAKDVDGLTTLNSLARAGGKKAFTPATARGVMELLAYYKVPVKGKKAVVFGRSVLAGGPIAEALSSAGAEVVVCHSKTSLTDQISASLAGDVVVTAIGKPKYFGPKFFKHDESQVVIDVGMTSIIGTEAENLPGIVGRKKFQGDVDFEAVEPIVGAITPVPGGIGLMTVLGLFENLVDAVQS